MTDCLSTEHDPRASTPPTRFRCYPRLLDSTHVAELLGELFIDALNDPEAIDTKRLQALTHLAQLLLKAIGGPKDPSFAEPMRAESPSAEDDLVRVYPPLPPEVETLLAAAPTAATAADLPRSPYPDPANAEQDRNRDSTGLPGTRPSNGSLSSDPHNQTAEGAPEDAFRSLLAAVPVHDEQPTVQAGEQEGNKPSTSTPGTNGLPDPVRRYMVALAERE
jgi:hypothetical protein